MKEKGERSLHEAQSMRDQWESRSKSIEQRMLELKEEEKKVAIVSQSSLSISSFWHFSMGIGTCTLQGA